MASEHTAKAFDSDLQELTRLVAEMGGLAERMIVDAVDALIRRDVALGRRVVETDVEIDNLQHVIEERAVLTIARRQPMAVDLREIVGAMRVATDLERIGDLAKNMGKRVAALESDFQPLKLIRGLEHMTDLVLTIAFYCAVVRVLATMKIDNEPYYKEVLRQYPIPGVK